MPLRASAVKLSFPSIESSLSLVLLIHTSVASSQDTRPVRRVKLRNAMAMRVRLVWVVNFAPNCVWLGKLVIFQQAGSIASKTSIPNKGGPTMRSKNKMACGVRGTKCLPQTQLQVVAGSRPSYQRRAVQGR